MIRKTFDSSEYYRARDNFGGFCLGCGAKIGFTKRLILTKSGDLRQSDPPNHLMCCNGTCESVFVKRSIRDWASLRSKVIKRDDYTCRDCGFTAPKRWNYQTDEGLEVHHEKPISEGGQEFDEDNCVTLCHDCHVGPLGRHSRAQNTARRHICLERFAEVAP